jgi:NTE family protein
MSINRNLKWALVLSGGGAKGLAHVGILKAFAGMGFPEPSLVVGTSMGAIVGGLYACGMEPAELYRFVAEEFDITKYLDSFVFKLNGPVGRILQAGQLLGSLAARTGIDPGDQVLALLEDLSGHKLFSETRIPFRCNAVDLISGREQVFRSGSVAKAIRASMSFPVFFEPLLERGMCLVDGGLVDNMPVHIARAEGFKRVLAVDVGAFRTRPAMDLDNGAKIMYRSLEVVLNKAQGRKEGDRPSLVVHASDKNTPFGFFNKKELLALGERAVREHEKTVRAFFSGGVKAYFIRKRHRSCGIRAGEGPVSEREEWGAATDEEHRSPG